jgi:hypothetical protein
MVSWIDVVVAGEQVQMKMKQRKPRHNLALEVYKIKITAKEMTLRSRRLGIFAVEACPISAASQHLGNPRLIEPASAIKKLCILMGTWSHWPPTSL